MEVDEFQAIGHFAFFEHVDRFEQLARIKSEFALIAARFFPFTAARTRQFDANADVGAHAEAFGDGGNQAQFVQFLDDDKNAPPHFVGEQSQFDIVFVFISVANDQVFFVDARGKHGMQFGFGSGFKPDVEFFPVRHDFFHHLPHLVYFYGVNDKILRIVFIFVGRFTETARYFFDPIVEDVGETKQHGRRDVAHLQFVHQIFQIDRCISFARGHLNVSFLVD